MLDIFNNTIHTPISQVRKGTENLGHWCDIMHAPWTHRRTCIWMGQAPVRSACQPRKPGLRWQPPPPPPQEPGLHFPCCHAGNRAHKLHTQQEPRLGSQVLKHQVSFPAARPSSADPRKVFQIPLARTEWLICLQLPSTN